MLFSLGNNVELFLPVDLAPSGGCASLLVSKDLGEVALRKEARRFGNIADGQFGLFRQHSFGVLRPEVGDPLAERRVADVLEVTGQVGTVGSQCLGHFFDGQAVAGVAGGSFPLFQALGDGGVVQGEVVRRVGIVRPRGGLVGGIVGGQLGLQDALHLFVEEQVVQVRPIEVDVEGNGREDPQDDVAVRQEREQPATHTEDDGPPREDGHPADVGTDVVGMGVVEETDRPVVGQDEPARQPDAVGDKPQGQCQQSRLLERAFGQHQQHHARQNGEHGPQQQVDSQSPTCDVETVELCGQSRTEEPVGQEEVERFIRMAALWSRKRMPQNRWTE